MKRILPIFLYVSIFFLACCSTGKGNIAPLNGAVEENLYAEGFEIAHYKGFSTISVVDPWDTAKVLQRYILVERGKDLPDNLPEGTLIRTPVQNVIMYTTIHASIWEELESLDGVVGICEPEYLTSGKALQMMEEGKIHDCGKAASPNVEKIMEVGGEIIIASPFEHGGYGQAEKLGIPIFESADYMETHPLGRVEWMKVFGMLQGKRALADSLFKVTMNNYNRLKALVANVEHRPRVMSERKYGSSWFIVGGASYIAQMYKDAGAEYIFSDNTETGSVPIAFETVFERGEDSDIWIFKYAMPRPMLYSDLKGEYEPYAKFAPFRNRNIYICNTVTTPYYEYIAIHPDYILADYVKMFHPELMPDYNFVCYEAMRDNP
ncbi:MAG: ABC transporter substrate-binding protein [Bacteroidales bacterium]|nr:ABC transporter substrate-binding protein [Bacteroidales bacterium]